MMALLRCTWHANTGTLRSPDSFSLGKRSTSINQTTKGNTIVPIRSTSALILSSTNINREKIYIQQPPISAAGYSSQAFAPHFPHTVRKTETKTCSDCHLSQENNNNAIMAQLLLQGTNFVNFIGYNSWIGNDNGIEAIRVTEWDEPQAVIGSFLHKYAYPDWYQEHKERDKELYESYDHKGGEVGCLQNRGEYMFVAEGKRGFRIYDIASIANKGVSQRIITAPFAPLGHNTQIKSKNATCVALPTNQPIAPTRMNSSPEQKKLMTIDNQEQPIHPLYSYAFVTDKEEGLIVIDVDTFADGEPRNNFINRSITWNPDNILSGSNHITLAGTTAYISTNKGIIVIDLNNPIKPKLLSKIPFDGAKASAVQFRYLFVNDDKGFNVVDITDRSNPKKLDKSLVPIIQSEKIYLARTFAYIASRKEGLIIIDIENPEKPKLFKKFNANGKINDARDVVVGSTNASLFAYIADGKNGLKVVQLTSPDSQPRYYGFSPDPAPELIAWYKTNGIAKSLAKGLDRDRAVDETGNQMAILGRLGSRPFNEKEQKKLYLNPSRQPWFVNDEVEIKKYVP